MVLIPGEFAANRRPFELICVQRERPRPLTVRTQCDEAGRAASARRSRAMTGGCWYAAHDRGMAMQNREPLAALCVSLALVAGCGGGGYGGGGGLSGGGGGYGGGAGNLMSAPGEAAVNAYFQAAHQSMLSAKDASNNSWTLQFNRVPNAGTTTFNGSAPAYSTVDTVTIKKNGTTVANSISTAYFMINPFVPLGNVSSTGTPYALVTSSFPLPASFTVGSNGSLENLTYYHDSTKATVDISQTGTYAVTANNASTVLVCFSVVLSNVTAQGTADGLANGTETDCYTVNAAGSATLVSVTVTVSNVTLKFQ